MRATKETKKRTKDEQRGRASIQQQRSKAISSNKEEKHNN
jgi:hypothetical protein